MSTMKTVWTTIEKKKDKIAKFFILCAGAEFFISTLWRIINVKDSRQQEETLINIYSMFFVTLICFHELFNCLLCSKIEANLLLLTHYTGKGVVFSFISFIYMSPSRGIQQNYSAILMFACAVICFLADFKVKHTKSAFELAVERSKFTQEMNSGTINGDCIDVNNEISSKEIKIDVSDNNTKKADNPYDVLEDF